MENKMKSSFIWFRNAFERSSSSKLYQKQSKKIEITNLLFLNSVHLIYVK